VNLRHSVNGLNLGALLLESVSAGEREVLNEGTFKRMISIERKRTERSRKPFLLMLLDTGNRQESEKNGKALGSIVSALLASIRETDVTGWYKSRATVGVLFTELAIDDKNSILGTMLTKVSTTLQDKLRVCTIFSSVTDPAICGHRRSSGSRPCVLNWATSWNAPLNDEQPSNDGVAGLRL